MQSFTVTCALIVWLMRPLSANEQEAWRYKAVLLVGAVLVPGHAITRVVYFEHRRVSHEAQQLYTHGVQERRELPDGLACRFAANEWLSPISSAARSLPLRSTCHRR